MRLAPDYDGPPSAATEPGQSVEGLLPTAYRELRSLAALHLARERGNHTLQPTALVHEVYLRLRRQRSAGWKDRGHFLAVASNVMRRVLVDHARVRDAAKRRGIFQKDPLDEIVARFEESAYDLLALDEALESLGRFDARKARVVELRFFAGMSVEDTAHALDMSVRSVEREWALAKAWLRGQLTP